MSMPLPEYPGLVIDDLPNGGYRVTRAADAPASAWGSFLAGLMEDPVKCDACGTVWNRAIEDYVHRCGETADDINAQRGR